MRVSIVHSKIWKWPNTSHQKKKKNYTKIQKKSTMYNMKIYG